MHQHHPGRADQGEPGESGQQQARPPTPPAQQHQQQVGQRGQDRVERDLDRQAPHLGQPLVQQRERVVVGVDLGEGEVAQQPVPGVAGVGPRGAKVSQQVGRQHGDDVGGHDPPEAPPGVAPQRRARRPGLGRLHPRPEQQEPRQREEDRHPDLHPRIDQPEVAVGVLTGGVGGVGGHHQGRGQSSHTGERGNPVDARDGLQTALVDLPGGHQSARRDFRARSGLRSISTPEILVLASFFRVSLGIRAGNSTREWSLLMVM